MKEYSLEDYKTALDTLRKKKKPQDILSHINENIGLFTPFLKETARVSANLSIDLASSIQGYSKNTTSLDPRDVGVLNQIIIAIEMKIKALELSQSSPTTRRIHAENIDTDCAKYVADKFKIKKESLIEYLTHEPIQKESELWNGASVTTKKQGFNDRRADILDGKSALNKKTNIADYLAEAILRSADSKPAIKEKEIINTMIESVPLQTKRFFGRTDSRHNLNDKTKVTYPSAEASSMFPATSPGNTPVTSDIGGKPIVKPKEPEQSK